MTNFVNISLLLFVASDQPHAQQELLHSNGRQACQSKACITQWVQ